MPPEPPPWDRRDFVFREKKHDRGVPYPDALGGGGSSSVPRWREPYHAGREFPTPSPRRPPSGYYRHGSSGSGYHSLFPDEPCSRSEDDGFRTYQSGRYGGSGNRTGNNREGGGYFRRSSWDSGDPPRQHHDSVASQRSVADPLSHPSSHLIPFEDQHDKTGGGVDDGSRAGHKHDRDPDHSLGSLQWKPLKWSRSGSFSSASKVVRSESDEGRLEVVLPSKETPVQSPVASPLPLDDGLSRKKQRLGWGQGLAKYEKAKSEGTDDGSGKNPLIQCGSGTKASPSDASPKLTSLPGSDSPATPASVACSSSHGGEDKHSTKLENNDFSTNLSNSPCHESQNGLENFSINSEHLDLNSLGDISSLLADLLRPEDACSMDSHFMRQTAMSKLLLLRSNILKQIEKTESEIDLFENELKKLKSEYQGSGPSQMPLNMNSECERSDPCQRSLNVSDDHLLQFSGEHTSAVTKVSRCSMAVLASDVASLIGNRPSREFFGEAVEQGNLSPKPVDSVFRDSTYTEKETCDYGPHKGDVLESGSSILSDADHMPPSTSGNEPIAIYGDDARDLSNISNFVHSDPKFGQECCSVTASIMAFNRESAKRADEILGIPFPMNSSPFQAMGSCDNLLDHRKELHIRSTLATLKCFLRFKERVLILKYRAFQHLWKEDLRLLAIRKHRSKSQKKFELHCRSSQNSSQRNRSLRSRFAFSGNLTLVPTSEILEFTSKLLSDSQIKRYRNSLRMPALILDDREKEYSRFITNNGLIEDPCSFEKERSMINPWTTEEREIFMEMLAMYGKDFTKIASFLSHKTTADCVEFYYKNHKSESFEKVKRSLGLRKNCQVIPANSYLLTSDKKWKREINAASLDVLGTASLMASQADDNMRVQHRFSGRPTFGSQHVISIPHGTCAAFEMSSNVDVLGQEQETSAADVLIGICGALSSEAMSSCVTTSFDPGEKMNFVSVDRHLASEFTPLVDEDTCSDEGCGELDSTDWTDEEKSAFISALSSYGRDFGRISLCVRTRSKEQCKIFFSKARRCLGLDAILRGTLSDANVGKSDTEDAGMFEIDSAMCSTQSCSRVEVEFTHSTTNDSSAVSGQAAEIPLQIDLDTCSDQHEIGVSSQEKVKTEVGNLAQSLNCDGTELPKKEETNAFGVTERKAFNVDLISNVSMQLSEFADRHPGGGDEDGNDPAEFPGDSVSTDGVVGVQKMDSRASAEPLSSVPGKDSPGDSFRSEFELEKVPVPKAELDDVQQLETCPTAGSMTGTLQLVSEASANDGARLLNDKVDARPKTVFTFSYMQQLDLLRGMDKRAQFVLQEKEGNPTLSPNTLLPHPLSVQFKDQSQAAAAAAAAASQSVLNFEAHTNQQQKISADNFIYRLCSSGKQSIGQSAPVLRGYALQVLKEVNGQAQAVCERSVLSPNCQKKSGSALPPELFRQDSHGESGSHQSQLGSVISLAQKDSERAGAQLRPCLQSSFKETEPSVKLFGQILSHPSPAQRPTSPARCNSHKPSGCSQASGLSLSNGHSDGPLPLQRAERSHHQSRQEVPGRNCGIWVDNSMQRGGVQAVPESGMLLAKHPGASLSCYTVKDHHQGSCCGFVQQAYLQPLTVDGNRGDISFDLQKHRAFESVSGFQHQGRVSLGRVAGSSAILVGSKGGCTGVSDPVAALKMHYAARAGILGSEEESWRADIGR